MEARTRIHPAPLPRDGMGGMDGEVGRGGSDEGVAARGVEEEMVERRREVVERRRKKEEDEPERAVVETTSVAALGGCRADGSA